MEIPVSGRKKALVIVDVQHGFLNNRNSYIVDRIKTLIKSITYDFYVEAIFHAEKGSLWDKQAHWILPKDKNFKTVDGLVEALSQKDTLHVEKETKSVFKGAPILHGELKKRSIEELHIVGLDVNDCVLATAYEAFDLGYSTYVLEECTESSDSEHMREAGIKILRHVNLTNNSRIEEIRTKKL